MKCKHENMWFDREVYICGPDCSEMNNPLPFGRMHDVCDKCGQTECQIKEGLRDAGKGTE